ncbi:MAG: type III pantothenate kinase [Tannerella sp.]|nr:type III pantothenate kinase [Tannerella sp.]
MNLVIDQGNTKLKAALFDGDKIEKVIVTEADDVQWMQDLCCRFRLDKGIMSSVGDTSDKLLEMLRVKLPQFVWFDDKTCVPLQVAYKSRATLGRDRLAAAVGASYLRPGENILVIDAGTAITYELVEQQGVYVGGNISPGMTMRFRALNQFTKRLPLMAESESVPLVGFDTETAILSGVINGIVFEMDGYIDLFKAKYGDVFVFLTGGNSFYFEKRIKNLIFADANLVLIGLNRILEYNAK